MFKKLWIKILNKTIGSYVKDQISELSIQIEKLKELHKTETETYIIPVPEMSKNKKKKVLEKVKKEMKKVNKETKKKAKK